MTRERSTTGHFIGALGAPLYVVGVVWIGSRATVVELVAAGGIEEQLALYELRYESLLQVVRAVVLVLSVIFIWLCLTGRSHYPRMMAVLNPIFLIIVSFVIFFTVPSLGKFMMPIALNVAYFVMFSVSLFVASNH